MTGVAEVAGGIYCARLKIPGVHTVFSAYIIKEGGGVLIEPGPAALLPQVQAVLREVELESLAYIIPTHIHLDHGGAAGELAALFPGTRVVIHPRARKHVVDPSRLIRSTRLVYGRDFETVYGAIRPVPEAQLKVVRDGERLSLDGRELMIVYTPGHAPHHLSIFDTGTGMLFSGEALGLIYHPGIEPLPAVALPSFDLEVYLASMEKLRRLEPRWLLLSHDGVGREPVETITAVERNTRRVGEVILTALRAGETDEGVFHLTDEYLREHYGARLEKPDLQANVDGYIYYYRKRGLA
jgi:glyoxylase-like metal-dependent hydrolase (beta-lactamase superfamily II)